jgi:hypothetical protein
MREHNLQLLVHNTDTKALPAKKVCASRLATATGLELPGGQPWEF